VEEEVVRRVLRLAALVAPVALASVATAGACAKASSLLSPSAARLGGAGPDSFTIHVVTSRGPFDIRVHRDWAPRGADRLHYLTQAHYYDGVRFYRVADHFVAQFGLHGDTAVSHAWRARRIDDDTVRHSNVRGTIAYAAGGPNTRTTQLFISYGDNSRLDQRGFAVVAQVVSGMDVVDSLHNGYGEAAPGGKGPTQERIMTEGNAYLVKGFPLLDYIITARITQEWRHR
jgi:cyclophilin family peptidyl-prolyl cis-trans isomerase